MQPQTVNLTNYKLLGVEVNSFNLEGLLQIIGTFVYNKKRAIISSQNIHSIYIFHRNTFLQQLQRISIKRIDGMPIVYCGRLLGYPLKKDNRITWVDLIRPLMQRAADNKWKVFYLGADEATISKGVSILRRDHKGLIIDYANGFFNEKKGSQQNDEIIQKINTFLPDVLVVGMGMPRQEKWILDNIDAINATVIMTSGAAIEYVAGKVSTPPRWMGRTGLEWLYRFVENPKRFWFRYMIEPWFVFWLFLKDFGRKYILRKDL